MRGLMGLANSSLAPCQYRPLCRPSSLTSFWANCLGWSTGGRAKYCFCASTNSRHASMAASSFLPMRRNTISSFPASVSKYHVPWWFTKGIGNGQYPNLPSGHRTRGPLSRLAPGCSMELDRPVPALRQIKRRQLLQRRQRSAVPAPGRTLARANSPRKVRTQRTRQIEQTSCTQVEPKSKSFEAWYSSPFVDYCYALPHVHAISDVVHHRHHGNHLRGSRLQSSTARGMKSLGHCRRDQSR